MNLRKRSTRRLILAVCAVGVLFIALAALHFIRGDAPPQTANLPISYAAPHKKSAVVQPAATPGLPVRLTIPKINVSAAIESVGLTPEGDMQSPNKVKNVAWYKYGVRPGNAGSAVFAGHYGRSRTGEVAIFDQLHTLSKGDLLSIEDEKGTAIEFAVREFQTYGVDEIVPSIFGSNDRKAHLNIITCTGTWDKARQTYSQRLVLFADKK